jgi:diaminopimelate decarboxylase
VRPHPAGPLHGDQLHPHAPSAPPADAAAMAALDPAVWSGGTARDPDGVLTVAGHDIRDLAAAHGTPLLVLDEEDFRSRCAAFRSAFDGSDVHYAAKAFLTTAVARWVQAEGLGLDVATGGELTIALRAGFPAGRVVLHGNNKSTAELAAALDAGVGRVVLDSFEEIARIAFLAAERGLRPKVLVRVTVGVEAHTHEFIATAHEDQKFGFSLAAGQAAEAVRRVLAFPQLELVGLHSHIGSQIFDTSGFEVAAHRVVALAAQIRAEHGVEMAEINLGGGLGIAYVSGDDPPELAAFAASLRAIVHRECAAYGLAVPRTGFEPGRALVGPSTLTVYEVGTVKDVELDGGVHRSYVSVDGGMSDNVRTALYDAEYTVVLASRASDAGPVLARVVGRHCESGDVVVKDAWLPADLAAGDLLAVAATGAYCRAMASNYNAVGRPPVVAVRVGSQRTLLRRETVEDLLALDQDAGPLATG